MTFSDKVESSIILSSERIHYKQLNILNGYLGIILFFVNM